MLDVDSTVRDDVDDDVVVVLMLGVRLFDI